MLFFRGKPLPFSRRNSWQIQARQKEQCPRTEALRLGRTQGTHGAVGGKQQGAPCPRAYCRPSSELSEVNKL